MTIGVQVLMLISLLFLYNLVRPDLKCVVYYGKFVVVNSKRRTETVKIACAERTYKQPKNGYA